jgi:LmbE family N-acetylglucosaminyl deacetylase
MSKTIVAFGAHCDDSEIGVGGILLKAVQAGHRVVIVCVVSDFSTWSLTKGREAATIEGLKKIASARGFEKRFLGRAYHVTDGSDLEFKRELARLYLELKPEVAFVHHHEDHFSDHVAVARATHDALMFPHGLSGDLNAPRCPAIYGYTVTPWQTYRFSPDVFCDVTSVMPEYMRLLNDIDECYFGTKGMRSEFRSHDFEQPIELGAHAFTKFGDCIQHGSMAGCRYAVGLQTAWKQKKTTEIF